MVFVRTHRLGIRDSFPLCHRCCRRLRHLGGGMAYREKKKGSEDFSCLGWRCHSYSLRSLSLALRSDPPWRIIVWRHIATLAKRLFAGSARENAGLRYDQTGELLLQPAWPVRVLGTLEVFGPLVAGRYSHPFGTFAPKPNEGYFILDTHVGQFTDFKTIAELEARLGRKINLVSTTSFRSTEAAYKRQQTLNKIIMFAPPIGATIAYFLWLSRRGQVETGLPVNRETSL